ncbi:membrane protein [Stenotrophomonas maltophilia]|nr:membrane protein [Stenotrophomonas maltophilia]
MFNADGSVRVPGQEGDGHAARGAPGGANDGWSKERIAQSGTWLKRPPYDYTPTSFDKYWVPQESLLAEWVRKGVKAMEIPLPGTNTRISCVISILQAGGGCGLTNPNMQDQPAVARPPPDIPFKKELQEDNGSR